MTLTKKEVKALRELVTLASLHPYFSATQGFKLLLAQSQSALKMKLLGGGE